MIIIGACASWHDDDNDEMMMMMMMMMIMIMICFSVMHYKLYPTRKYWLPLSKEDMQRLAEENTAAIQSIRSDEQNISARDPRDLPDEEVGGLC
jgi:ABC-type multidrug transport system permease subunit